MQPQQYIERKNAQNYHKTAYPSCINCLHVHTKRTTIPNNNPDRKPISVYLQPKCSLGEFHVTANGSCDLFEYSRKVSRKIERNP